MSGELSQLNELEKRHNKSKMIHWTENLEGISLEVKDKVDTLKLTIERRNKLVRSIAIFDDTINKMEMNIGVRVSDSGKYNEKQIEAALELDTCTLINLD